MGPGSSPNWVAGIDVSEHQKDVDWAAVKRGGIRFAWVKATEGATRTDLFFTQNVQRASAAGIPMAPYHFAFPQGDDALEEAEFFLRVGFEPHADLWVLPPALDFERPHPRGAQAATDWVITWLERVEAATGVKPVLYTGHKAPPIEHERLTRWNLWLPSYTGDTEDAKAIDPDPTKLPEPGTPRPWHVWQYTGSGRPAGVNGDCDRNVATIEWWESIVGRERPEEHPLEEPMLVLKHAGQKFLLFPSHLILVLDGPAPPDAQSWEPAAGMWEDLVVANEKVRKDMGLVVDRIPRT